MSVVSDTLLDQHLANKIATSFVAACIDTIIGHLPGAVASVTGAGICGGCGHNNSTSVPSRQNSLISLSFHWQSLGRYDRWLASRAPTLAKGERLCSTARELPHYHNHDTRSLSGYCKAVERQQAYNRLVGIVKECRPVVARHDHLVILHADALHEVADSGSLACCLDVGLWWQERPPRHPLQ